MLLRRQRSDQWHRWWWVVGQPAEQTEHHRLMYIAASHSLPSASQSLSLHHNDSTNSTHRLITDYIFLLELQRLDLQLIACKDQNQLRDLKKQIKLVLISEITQILWTANYQTVWSMPECFKVVLDHARRYISARLYLFTFTRLGLSLV